MFFSNIISENRCRVYTIKNRFKLCILLSKNQTDTKFSVKRYFELKLTAESPLEL